MMLPKELGFSVGALHLSASRVFLIVMFFPALSIVMKGKLLPCDWLMFFFVFWGAVTLGYHHGIETGVESGGILTVETVGAYLIARAYIRNARTFKAFVRMLTIIVIALAIFTIPESLTGKPIIRDTARMLIGARPWAKQVARFGLIRAYGPFEHPIHYGVFCAGSLGLAWYVLHDTFRWTPKRLLMGFLIFVSTFMSVSSGAVAAFSSQAGMITWDRLLNRVKQRWVLLLIAFVAAYGAVEMFSNREAPKVVLHYLSFNAHTAYNRYIIWEWGLGDVIRNPLMGIGFNLWTRPPWMHSTSMDCFWLVMATRHGVPGFLAILGTMLYTTFALVRRKNFSNQLAHMRKGWIVTIMGLALVGTTVHFWNALYLYFCFLLGAAGWMLAMKPQAATAKSRGSSRTPEKRPQPTIPAPRTSP